MISRPILIAVATLVAGPVSVTAQDSRSGINLCAAYHIVVPLIEDGEDSCNCEGRAIVCEFQSICEEEQGHCADLDMTIDFSGVGQETIIYDLAYGQGVGYSTANLVLDVSSKVTDGIQGCTATLDDEICNCVVCEEGRGVDITCAGSGVSTMGCFNVDVSNFDRFVPFMGSSGGTVIAGVEIQDRQTASTGSSSNIRAVTVGATTVLAAATAMIM